MTAIPCFMGTCSIDLDADPVTGQLIANARTADTGSLGCVDRLDPDETDGLFVQVSGLVQDATSGVNAPCGQSLGRAVNGDLFAYPEGALMYDIPGLTIDTGLPDDAADPDGPVTDDVVRCYDVLVQNPWECAAWAIYTIGEMKVTGRRRPDVTAEVFWATIFGELEVGGGVTDVVTTGTVNRKDIHGIWDGAANAPEHAIAWNMHAAFRLSPGGLAVVRNRINVASRRRFTLQGNNAGIFFLHPWVAIWREDAHPVDNPQPSNLPAEAANCGIPLP